MVGVVAVEEDADGVFVEVADFAEPDAAVEVGGGGTGADGVAFEDAGVADVGEGEAQVEGGLEAEVVAELVELGEILD